MIVISKADAEKFGEQSAEVGIWKPIAINGGLYVVHDECEDIVKSLDLPFTKRAIAENEWIKTEV